MSRAITCVSMFLGVCFANSCWAQGQQQSNLAVAPGFGGPNAVENQLANEKKDWGVWKKELEVNHGLSFGLDYTALFLSSSDTTANETAAGGIARAFGVAQIIKNGALVFKFEHRHEFGSPAPADFALSELGYVGLIGAPFNNSEFRTQNLYWRQRMNGGRSTLIAGVLDPTDYVDAFAMASPWLHFMNFAFSTGSASIGLPNDAAVGVAYGTMLSNSTYLIAGITDTNGDPGDPFQGFSNFFSDNEYFTSLEFGWTASQKRVMLDNIHVTAWHKDRQSVAGISDGWGLAFSLSRYINDNFMPFVRGGYAKDGGSLLQKSISIGMGYQTKAFNGLVGAGLNWGDPNETTFSQGLQDQWAVEVFYRLPIGKYFTVTGDVQYIKDPALNPIQNTMWMFNLRGRASF
jgi:porin